MKVRKFKLLSLLAGVSLSVATLSGMTARSNPDGGTQPASAAAAQRVASTPAQIAPGALPARSFWDLQNIRGR